MLGLRSSIISFVFLLDVVLCGVLHHTPVHFNSNNDEPNSVDNNNGTEEQGGLLLRQDVTNEIFEEGEPLNELDYVNGNKLDLDEAEETLYSFKEDPLLKAGLFEGDIQDVSNISDFVLGGRNAILDMNLRWVDGEIPYSISSEYNSHERSVIARAMSDYHSRTCIRFKPRTSSDSDYIYLTKGHGCSSSVGRQGGGQQVSLGQGCVYHGVVVHELMHAAGFWHEQSRADRDAYITILWSNIMRGMEYNFQKYSWQYIQNLEEDYDLGSVMHYDSYAFSAHRGKPTIMSKDRSRSNTMGQRHGFSSTDIRKINKLYACKTTGNVGSKIITPKPGQCLDSNSQCQGWAQSGECERNPIWMKANCLKSCGICGRSSCVDNSAKCKAWAIDSECKNNPNYMLNYCKKACGAC